MKAKSDKKITAGKSKQKAKKKNLARLSKKNDIFDKVNYKRMTIRIPRSLANSLDKFVEENATKQRQKIKVIILALENFLSEQGFYSKE